MKWNFDRHVLNKVYRVSYINNPHRRMVCFCICIFFIAYTCFGSWQDNNTRYVIASPVLRTSTEPRLYCLVYTLNGNVQHEGTLGRNSGPPILRLSAVTESCHRHVVPGATGLWFFNFTSNGKNGFKIIYVK